MLDKVEDEPPMVYSRLWAHDGNNSLNSLKRVLPFGNRKAADVRVFDGSEYFLPRKFVDKFANEVKTHRRTPSRSPDPKFANGLVPPSQFSVSPTASPRKDKFKEKKVHYQLGQKGNVSKEDVREEINPPRKAKRNSVNGDTGVSVRSLRIALGSVL